MKSIWLTTDGKDSTTGYDLQTTYDSTQDAAIFLNSLIPSGLTEDTTEQGTIKTLRIYDRNHNVLDEIMTHNGLQYTWTLNGTGKAQFNLGLEDVKCTDENMQFFNHMEILDDAGNVIWGGEIVTRDFADPALQVGAYGYLYLFQKRRLRAKTYPLQTYDQLLAAMINDINAIAPTGVSIGNLDSGALQTTRDVQNTDFLLDKITEFIGDTNYDMEVDVSRNFNFYLRKGSDKPWYVLEYGGQADNILVQPQLSQSVLDMANNVYCETNGLSSTAQDTGSQGEYGLLESVLSANSGVTQQSTLDNMVQGAVQRQAYPINSFTIQAKNSSLCPFNDIEIGDAVTISLPKYFGFSALMRIIEMTHYEDTGARDIVFGQIIYRPQPPVKRLYKG